MTRATRAFLVLLASVASTACDGSDPDDAGVAGGRDAGALDAGAGDAGALDAGPRADAGPRPDAGPAPSGTLAARYPRDEGIASDPAVLWHEGFEQTSVAALAMRYESSRTDGMTLAADRPAASPGAQSVRMTAGGAAGDSTDLYKLLPGDGYEQLYVRWYVRHETGASYHHSGARFGAYNPPSRWPQGGAGLRPRGDDSLSVAFEPIGEGRMDFYNYWMRMRSWMAEPMEVPGAYYGNTLVHRGEVATRPGTWQCIETMARLNEPGSARDGELALWIDDRLVYHYTEDGPRGYWVRDKFCPSDADADSCVPYAPPPAERMSDVLDLTWRSAEALRLNYLWLLNYVSSGEGTLSYDDVVVATARVGCIQP
ncbi:MAG: hypothetical protein KF729_31545 [Sandaracinaceae bacterium]|nr:hypothetical protein [Sandaracinaceae bacterium]